MLVKAVSVALVVLGIILAAVASPTRGNAAEGSFPRLPLGFGRPVPLTAGEKQQLVFLSPGLDVESLPPEYSARLRDIIHHDRSDHEKRSMIRSLLNR
ncbi:MAG: hypothetical protein ACX93U_06675 [Salipiger thiooxidans]|jgi:hypothetical protein|uniref:hypothetical protein n=1 Tax=Salipiger thiooxidans TaxID=282683 RepID=UPI001A8D8263|nr:hypothetical protein [Salipiger thiooxidans]MBN8186618.1 hypothetical protein [Salipiger thiooxidans]MBR9836783.1 hypothetical protein [Paracoccaceae bacterium]